MNDAQLLEFLAQALAIDVGDPSPESIAALHRAVVGRPAWHRVSWRRRLAVPAFAAVAVLGAGGTAFAASGKPLPEPLRRVAYDVGVPVDSPNLARTKALESTVRHDLARADKTGLAKAAEQLQHQLGNLDEGDRNQVSDDATRLLTQAHHALDQHGPTGGQGPVNQNQPSSPEPNSTEGSGAAVSPTGASNAPGPTGTDQRGPAGAQGQPTTQTSAPANGNSGAEGPATGNTT